MKTLIELLGDVLTECLPSLLINIYDDNLDSLFQLLLKSEADPGLRYLISFAISSLIAHGLINRDEVIARLQLAVASGKMNEDQGFYTAMANLVICSHWTPLYDMMTAAFKANQVDEQVMDFTYFNKHRDEEGTSLITERYLRPLNDVEQEAAGWGLYDGEKAVEPLSELMSPVPVVGEANIKNVVRYALIEVFF